MLIAPTAIRPRNRKSGLDRSSTRPALRVITRRANSRRCLQTAIRVISWAVFKEHMRCCSNNPRVTIHNSNTTIEITRGFPVCYATVVKTIHRNQRCPAKLVTRPARVVTRNSSRIQQARSARSVTQTRRVERSKHFHRCAVSTRLSITRSTVVRHVPLVIGAIVVALGSRFLRG